VLTNGNRVHCPQLCKVAGEFIRSFPNNIFRRASAWQYQEDVSMSIAQNRAALLAVFALLWVGVGQANADFIINGQVWLNQADNIHANDTPTGTALQFTVSPNGTGSAISFWSGTDNTLNGFLKTGLTNNLPNDSSNTGYTGTANANKVTPGTGYAGNGGSDISDSFFQFTGSITLAAGDQIQIWHDDGIVLSLSGLGTVISDPAGSAVDTSTDSGLSTYTVKNAGTYSFTLNYVEIDGPPAELLFLVNGESPYFATPEPASWVMMITGAAGFSLYGWRRRNAISPRLNSAV
jgi:hypothetical protein